MTDDIVTRLRVWSRWLDERVPDSAVGDDLREAAAEIERLRKEVKDLRKFEMSVMRHAINSLPSVPTHTGASHD